MHVGAEYELHPGCRCHLPDGSGEMFFVQALLVEYCRTDRPDLADLAGEGLFLVFHCPARKSARRGRVLLELQPEFLPILRTRRVLPECGAFKCVPMVRCTRVAPYRLATSMCLALIHALRL